MRILMRLKKDTRKTERHRKCQHTRKIILNMMYLITMKGKMILHWHKSLRRNPRCLGVSNIQVHRYLYRFNKVFCILYLDTFRNKSLVSVSLFFDTFHVGDQYLCIHDTLCIWTNTLCIFILPNTIDNNNNIETGFTFQWWCLTIILGFSYTQA